MEFHLRFKSVNNRIRKKPIERKVNGQRGGGGLCSARIFSIRHGRKETWDIEGVRRKRLGPPAGFW